MRSYSTYSITGLSRHFQFALISTILAGSVFLSPLMGQDAKSEDGKEPPQSTKVIINIQDSQPLSETNSRFTITNLNFDRRFSPTGLGEFLDVVFDVKNLTSEDIDLYAFVLAYYETNAVNVPYRRVVPYPTWRVSDPEKEIFMVHEMTITPRDIPQENMWDDADPDLVKYRNIIRRMRNSGAIKAPIKDVLPPFWKYLSYLYMFPNEGLEFKLYGRSSPSEAEAIQTNFQKPTAEEKSTKIFKSISKHKYTLEHQRRQTIFRSHHYSEFRANYRFFNMVSIVIFDKEKSQAFMKAMEPLLTKKAILQEDRASLDKKKHKAEDEEDEKTLEAVIKEEVAMVKREEQMEKDIHKAIIENRHLAFQKTYFIGTLRND